MNTRLWIQPIACGVLLALASAWTAPASAGIAGASSLRMQAGTPAPLTPAVAPNRLDTTWPSLAAALGMRGPGATGLHGAPSLAAPPYTTGLAWIEQKVVAADGANGDLFGFRTLVAGDLAFVSAPAPLYRSGAVYVYQRTGDTWVETQKITATPPAGTPPNWSDFFGWSLSLSGDRLVVGAPEVFAPMTGPTGGVYVFTRAPDGQWTQSQLLASPLPITLSWFGRAVAFAGDAIIVGESQYDMPNRGSQGAAHVFKEVDGVWTETQLIQGGDSVARDGRNFGAAIAATADTVLIGAPGPDYASDGSYPTGAVYVYDNADGTLSEVEKLTASDGGPGDQFGYAVALSGATLLVGAPAADVGAHAHQGAGYVFDRAGGHFTETRKLIADDGSAFDQLGQSVALHGDVAVLGMWSYNDEPGGEPPAPRPGRVLTFARADGAWTFGQTFAASDGMDDNSFGWDVAFDGSTILVGADADGGVGVWRGAAYFYAPDDRIFQNGFED